MRSTAARLRVVVLVSGGGTNLQALLDAQRADGCPFAVAAVISNRPEAYGLTRAAQSGVPTATVDHTLYPDRAPFEAALMAAVDRHAPDLVVLAGFMRILTAGFVCHYRGRMLNIHPSLLPKFRGLHTHRRALEAGETVHGATVHFVTEELDGGPPIVQARVAVLAGDTPESLAARVLAKEHRIYPLAVRWFAEGRLRLGPGGVELDGIVIPEPARLEDFEDT
jgi:phosphoribosylglycinamide formyltransferase-1